MADLTDSVATSAQRSGRVRAALLDAVSEEAVRLVQQVYFSLETSPRLVIFASVEGGSGSSVICAAAAEALSQQSLRSVCLVDANVRAPSVAQLYGLPNQRGLTTALQSNDPLRSCGYDAAEGNLFVIPSGPLGGHDATLLTSIRLGERLEELRSEFDYVCVDAPPLTVYSDAVTLARQADGVVLVLQAEKTRRDAAKAAVATLLASNVSVLAAVLNKRTLSIPGSIYKRL